MIKDVTSNTRARERVRDCRFQFEVQVMTTEDANLLLEKQSYDVESGRSVDRMHIHSGEINDNEPPKAYMEVRVRGVSTTGDGDILASVDVKSTVWDLKKYIEYNVGVSCQQQRLIFQGKVMTRKSATSFRLASPSQYLAVQKC